MPTWSTACPDWADRLRARESIIPPPIFPDQAEQALAIFRELKIVDAGDLTFGESCEQWVFDLVASVFGAYDQESGRRLITEWFICLPKKNSKALALDTPIPTPNGWSSMGALQVGDMVFGADGRQCRVTATSEVFAENKCYRLTFSNGESVVADAGHQWFTRALHDVPGCGQGRGRRDSKKERVRTTQEIADTLLRRDGARNHSLLMPGAIECAEVDLPVAPYTLGAWLGDGHSACARLTCHDADVEIRDAILADGWPLRLTSNNGSKASTYSISDGNRTQAARNAGFAAKLRAIGVLNNKHIPDVYFRASRLQRLSLLQGLMDTDGTINKSGRVLSYCGKNERLVRGVAELLSTFGIKSTVIKRAVSCNGRPAGDAFYAQFMAFRDLLPVFRLRRKLDRMRSSATTSARSRTVQIVGAEEVAPVPVKCITVDAHDHQFLFGRSLLPTHNSTLAAGIMMTALVLNWRPSAEFAILAPTIEIAGNSYGPAKDMCAERTDEELHALMHAQTHVKTITHRESGAILKVVAADSQTVGGKKSVGTLVDELWLFGKQPNAANMLREAIGGLASRPEGFVIYLTTQSDEPPSGVFKQKLEYARKVRDGLIIDPKFVPIIYEFPPDMIERGEHKDAANFPIVNPNWGRSVDAEFIEREYTKAIEAGESEVVGFLAKHANVEVGLAMRSDRWAGADFWLDDRIIDKTLTLETLLERCEVVVVGIDGGGLDDLLGLCVLGRERGTRRWLAWFHAWAHKIALKRRQEVAPRLLDFQKDGDLTIVDEPGQDVAAVADIVCQVRDSGLMPEEHPIGVDGSGIVDIVDELTSDARGFVVTQIVAISQGWKLGACIKTTERKVAGGQYVHAGRPMMAWCVGNAKVEPKGNAILITKQASGTAKIDPLMAGFDAVELMMRNPEAAPSGSVYDDIGRARRMEREAASAAAGAA